MFPEIDEMRRGVPSNTETLGAEQRFSRRDGASLPVRAGDVQNGIARVRLADLREQGLRPLEAEPEASGGTREQVVERRGVLPQGVVHPVADGLPLMWRRSWLTVCLSSRRCTT